jgi:hypothetical protein
MDEMSRRYSTILSLRLSHTVGIRLPTAKDTGAGFNRLPEGGFMTALALCAETSLMLVIFFVAADAGG